MPENADHLADVAAACSADRSAASAGFTAAAVSAASAEFAALPRRVLMLGVGGMGMAPLAIYLRGAGVDVIGCDDHMQPRVATLLARAGVAVQGVAQVQQALDDGLLADVGLCAISSAIGKAHPLLARARQAGMHILRRGELLAVAARTRRLLAVVGSHGKTTTTALIIQALRQFGFPCDYVLGGLFQNEETMPARFLPGAQWLVAEIDESDGTIENFSPELTVAVNFDWDHTDRYGSAAALRQTFADLFARTAGAVIFPADDAVLASLVGADKAQPCDIPAEAKVRGFNGYNRTLAAAAVRRLLPQAESAAECAACRPDGQNTETRQDAESGREQQTAANVNAAGAIAFDSFGGIFRRQEWLYNSPALRIVTDYAHHPREMAALLAYLRTLYPASPLVAVFQPHRYTRTRHFAADFARVLAQGADSFLLMPVYAASEAPLEDGRSEAIADACNALCVAGGETERAADGRSSASPVSPVSAVLPVSPMPPISPVSSVSAASASSPVSSAAAVTAAADASAFVTASPVSSSVGNLPKDDPARLLVTVCAAAAVAGQLRSWLNRSAAASVKTVGASAASAAAPSVSLSDPVAPGASLPDAQPAGIDTVTLAFIGAGDIDALARRIAADCALRDNWQARLGGQTQVRLAEPLARRTTMRVGGNARFYAEPASHADLALLIALAKEAGLPVWLLGRGSNLIVPDAGFDGLVIAFNAEIFRVIEPQADGTWYVGSGVALKRLCSDAARAGLGGWEFLEGIPGAVGGALRMNAGAMGKWMFDVVEAVDVLEKDGTVRRRRKDEFSVEYRRCRELAEGAVALGAVLRPEVQVEVDAVRQRLENYASRRKETQPREPSAGCIFKNPPGHHAGALIDQLGLKGLRVGDAEVSAVHGNFIINRGEATAEDIMELVRRIRARVHAERGIDLEPEAILMGVRWEDVL